MVVTNIKNTYRPEIGDLSRNPKTLVFYEINVGCVLSNYCLTQTDRAILLQILTDAESQEIQCSMRSQWRSISQPFTSVKPVIDICQRKRVVHVSTKADMRTLEAQDSEGTLLIFTTLCFIINTFIPAYFIATEHR